MEANLSFENECTKLNKKSENQTANTNEFIKAVMAFIPETIRISRR